jgi:flagellar basal body L-ring protein FlgH
MISVKVTVPTLAEAVREIVSGAAKAQKTHAFYTAMHRSYPDMVCLGTYERQETYETGKAARCADCCASMLQENNRKCLTCEGPGCPRVRRALQEEGFL